VKANIQGNPLNVFSGKAEQLSDNHTFSLEPWGYRVYSY
jgi:hypothetical protein